MAISLNHFSTDGTEISLEQLLTAREERASLQQQLLTQYGQTLLCVTPNGGGRGEEKCPVGLCLYKNIGKSDRTFYAVEHHAHKGNYSSVSNGT